MRKLIAALTLTTGLIMTAGNTFASPTTEFEKGATSLEIGSTLNSKVSGRGTVSADVTGKSGFKATVTTGLNDHLALQYKQGMFISEDSTLTMMTLSNTPVTMTTYAKATPRDLNLLYKINPNLTFIAGYEDTKISYGKYVNDASKSALHFGLTGSQKLNDKITMFATLIGGKDVLLKELGVSYKMSTSTTFNLSYAERKVANLDLITPSPYFSPGKEDYTMKGISCLFAFKL
ncbi:hypothetical protein [Pelosinus sp. IPA-1]|uniref:hypothetical protein n=1 Tax=Pelosinus sp. IPA-1 TaxID=3029569 RepID=UPI00243618DB|nr:hypothetical protein [Pelosinus sp. IPA-1]GMA98977.1 hypothetical protein PIPA1_17770 [Pelosinus sp. IPA-1]